MSHVWGIEETARPSLGRPWKSLVSLSPFKHIIKTQHGCHAISISIITALYGHHSSGRCYLTMGVLREIVTSRDVTMISCEPNYGNPRGSRKTRGGGVGVYFSEGIGGITRWGGGGVFFFSERQSDGRRGGSRIFWRWRGPGKRGDRGVGVLRCSFM